MSRALFPALFVLAACSSHSAGTSDLAQPQPSDAAAPADFGAVNRASTDLLLPAAADNVVSMIMDEGPPGTDSIDVPFVSVTLCVPGTTSCQTIDHVIVDTGSSGLRIISSVLTGVQAAAGDARRPATRWWNVFSSPTAIPGARCGSADVKIGGELAAAIPLQPDRRPAIRHRPR